MTSPFSLAGRVVAVTGAAGLIGRCHAEALAAAGASLALGDLDGDGVKALAACLEKRHGAAALARRVDVTSPGSLAEFRDAVLDRFAGLHGLVTDAGLADKVESPLLGAGLARFEDYPLEAWRRMMDVNVTGTFLAAQVLGAPMAAAGRGSVVTVASTYGLVGPDPSLYVRPDGTRTFSKSPAYPAGKGAVLAFTRYLAAEWGPRGVRVNALVPGGVEAGQERWFVENYAGRTPLGRMSAPSDTGAAVVYLLSDASSYVTGTTLVVDGGYTAW